MNQFLIYGFVSYKVYYETHRTAETICNIISIIVDGAQWIAEQIPTGKGKGKDDDDYDYEKNDFFL